jgi:hypothetical protein
VSTRPRVDRAALLTGARSRVATPAANPLLPAEPDDPFTPRPIDPATVTGTAAERLTAFEAAMDRASEAAGQSLRAARARFCIEAGTALRAIHGDDLYRESGAETFEAYVKTRWGMSRSRAYQLIEAAPAMLAVSKILDTAPVESQALALAPVLQEHGENAAREVVTIAQQETGKVTAAAIKTTAGRLGYVPHPAPAPAAEDDPQTPADAALRQAVDRRALQLANDLKRGRIPRHELNRTLAEAFTDPDDTRVYQALVRWMKARDRKPPQK